MIVDRGSFNFRLQTTFERVWKQLITHLKSFTINFFQPLTELA